MSTAEWLDFAKSLCLDAGAIIRNALSSEMNISTKLANSDLVTETDQKVEKMISEQIKCRYPDHQFIGEESVIDGKKLYIADLPTWVVDPIDGTTNFTRHLTGFTVSIAVLYEKKPVVGCVYDVLSDKIYSATKGGGATLNTKPLKVSNVKSLDKSLVVTECGWNRAVASQVTQNLLNILNKKVIAVRMFGSAALNLCRIAEGCGDVYYEFGTHIWDIAAGVLILEEAGGILLDPVTKANLSLTNRRLVAAATKDLALEVAGQITNIPFDED